MHATWRTCGALLASTLLLAGAGLLRAADAPASPATVAGAPGLTGAVYGFFDNESGARTGQLRIGQMHLEYQSKGFLQVAWQPLVVLTGVDLEVGEKLAWPSQGMQIVRALRSLGGNDRLVLRDVRLHLAGSPSREIIAPTAQFRKGGVLELSGAILADGSPLVPGQATTLFWLAGPQAGRLLPGSPATVARRPAAGSTDVDPNPAEK